MRKFTGDRLLFATHNKGKLEEIADLLRAYNSGHRGGMTTLHADGVARVPSRLTSLGMLAGLRPEALCLLIEGAFDIVIHLERTAGHRHIAQLGVLGSAGTQLAGIPLSTWSGTGPPSYSAEWNRFAGRWQSYERPYAEEKPPARQQKNNAKPVRKPSRLVCQLENQPAGTCH